MIDREQIMAMLCRHAAVEKMNLTREQYQSLNFGAVEILSCGWQQGTKTGRKPGDVAHELQGLREHIRRVARRIADLDPWVLSTAGNSELQTQIDAAGGNVEAIMAAFEWWGNRSKAEWLGWGLADHLERLDRALQVPIDGLNRAASGSRSGPGRGPNRVARRMALAAGGTLIALTGRPVSYWRGSTAFAKVTEELFNAFGIDADTRRPCEWALSELGKKV